MSDSTTYMAIFDEGREKEAKGFILRLGQKRFGTPNESITAQLTVIADLERLHRLHNRIFDATSWQDLLDTP